MGEKGKALNDIFIVHQIFPELLKWVYERPENDSNP